MMSLTDLILNVGHRLDYKKWQVVTAESCTGGLIAAHLTEIPGSSGWFERGFVTYSNLAKHELLAVPNEVMESFGAVSEEVALAMALGALKHSTSHIAVSVTGIAGPDGGSLNKPVGTVCFAWATHDKTGTLKKHFSGNRQAIRLSACQQALEGLLDWL
ncbi:MAG: CinA family protein [Legionella sp.]|nr:CinA family protein [Legionella sp.]